MENYKNDTKCIHGGYKAKNGEPQTLPIIQSTTYKYESSDDMGKLFDLESSGFFYTRLANPTLDAVERKIAALENGVGAMLTSSGQAASACSVLNICKSGDHVICSASVYGGTFNLFNKTIRDLGIDFTFISNDIAEDELEKEFKSNTKCLFTESIANPSLSIPDFELFSRKAHEHGVPLIVDNTFPTPINFRPFEAGADIVVHSTTKYMDGHAVQVGGVVVDSGKFDWANGKFPMLSQPDETYHGITYTEKFGNAAYITKARVHLMRDFGCQAAPMNAFLLNMGLETLALRMERHCSNALKIAEMLKEDDRVEEVTYPALKGDKYYDRACKYMPSGTCGVISFTLKGGRSAAVKFMDSLKLASIVTHVADLRTCVLNPAGTTHRQLTDEQLVASGIAPGLVRLSVGIENAEDIATDIKNALSNI